MTSHAKHNFVDLQRFGEILRDHHFTLTQSVSASQMGEKELSQFILNLDKEMYIYNLAWVAGDDYVKTLSSYMARAKTALIPQKTTQELAYEELLAVIDEDIKEYAVKLKSHDWYWSFSDDHKISQRGDEAEDLLHRQACEKAGYYMKLWLHYVAKRTASTKKA